LRDLPRPATNAADGHGSGATLDIYESNALEHPIRMKIAITAETDQGLASPVAQHFGHTPYFVLVDLQNGAVSATHTLANPYAESHEPGQIPEFISAQGAEVMISGGMGGRAIGFFREAGVQTATGASGTVEDALHAYLKGQLQGAAPCAESVAHGHG